MYAVHAPPGLLLPVTAKLLHDLVGALHGDPDHRPHHVREGDARHVELDRRRVRPPGELPVKLGTQVERDPYRLGADRGLAGRPGVGTFVTASVGDVQPAIPLPLRRELTRWIAKARDAGLDDDSIEALFGDCFRAETAAGVA